MASKRLQSFSRIGKLSADRYRALLDGGHLATRRLDSQGVNGWLRIDLIHAARIPERHWFFYRPGEDAELDARWGVSVVTAAGRHPERIQPGDFILALKNDYVVIRPELPTPVAIDSPDGGRIEIDFAATPDVLPDPQPDPMILPFRRSATPQ